MSLQISLFSLLHREFGATHPLLQCSKATLVHVSHAIEDLVLTRNLPALLFTGFQESSHWSKETERYRALAGIAQQVCIFAGGELPPESNASQIHVRLRGEDPLRQEWFLVLLSTEFSVVLCGQDHQVEAPNEAQRQFSTLWSFDPKLVTRVLDLLESVLADYRPERLPEILAARQNFPPAYPDPAIVTALTSEMIRFQERLNQKLFASNQLLERQHAWRENLLATVVHDMRGPLTAIFGNLDLIRLGLAEPGEEMELATSALAGAERLKTLVQEILDTNQLDEGKFQLDCQLLTPDEIRGALMKGSVAPSRNRTVALDCEIHPSLRMVWADSKLLTRVLENLVGNALKFTESGGKVNVIMQPAARPGMVEIRVADSGQGIAADALPYIFDRYAQATKDGRGVGLGLYFARLAVLAMKGTLAVESQLGLGTTFTVTLPGRPPR